MPEGVIAGGWEFVTAAYLVTVIGLAGYGFSLWRRHKRVDLGEP